jgi:hypothetical protein
VPLWALQLDPSPLTLGLVLGARSFLPLYPVMPFIPALI